MGTQATHIDKLSRVWPGYAKVWREKCGFDPEGKTIWFHEGGWTPFPFLLSYLLTGRAGIVTNCEGRVQGRYLEKAIDAAASLEFPGFEIPIERREKVKALRGSSVQELIESLGGKLLADVTPASIPIDNESVDVCHSGGTLEHYHPAELTEFIRETFRILKPGGVASHIFDMRDHLYHADKKYPFLNHLAYSPTTYKLLFGHRLLFHNRLLPSEIVLAFEREGFRLIEARRLTLPKQTYATTPADFEGALAGIDRSRLHLRFEAATDEDLRTAAFHVLLRKPDK